MIDYGWLKNFKCWPPVRWKHSRHRDESVNNVVEQALIENCTQSEKRDR